MSLYQSIISIFWFRGYDLYNQESGTFCLIIIYEVDNAYPWFQRLSENKNTFPGKDWLPSHCQTVGVSMNPPKYKLLQLLLTTHQNLLLRFCCWQYHILTWVIGNREINLELTWTHHLYYSVFTEPESTMQNILLWEEINIVLPSYEPFKLG